MALGTIEVQGSDGIMRQVITYNSEQDVPTNWRQEAGGSNLAFTNPDPNGGLTTDEASARPGVDKSLIYDVVTKESSVNFSQRLRVVTPGASGDNREWSNGGDTINVIGVIISAIIIIAVAVCVAASIRWLTNYFGQKAEVAAVVANGGMIQKEDFVDLDGDGVYDIKYQTYNNGQVVSVPLTEAGVKAIGSATPIVSVDPAYTPGDINNIFNSGFWGQIATVIKYAVVGGAVLALIYVGVKGYQSLKTGKPMQFPMVTQMGNLAAKGGAKLLGGATA